MANDKQSWLRNHDETWHRLIGNAPQLTTWYHGLTYNQEKQPSIVSFMKDFDIMYEVLDVAWDIAQTMYSTIALQMGDSMLGVSPMLCASLEAAILDLRQAREKEKDDLASHLRKKLYVFVLGDTSFGDCCVDEVAAQHLDADLVVHYGRACLSPTASIPARYVFPKVHHDQRATVLSSIFSDIEQMIKTSPPAGDDHDRETIRNVLVLFLEFGLYYLHEDLEAKVVAWNQQLSQSESSGSSYRGIVLAKAKRDVSGIVAAGDQGQEQGQSISNQMCIGAYTVAHNNLPEKGDALAEPFLGNPAHIELLWIGTDPSSAALRNLALQYASQKLHILFPLNSSGTSGIDPSSIDIMRKHIGRRFHLIQKAIHAERIGVLAGTLAIHQSLDVINSCKKLIEQRGKRAYIVLVGKPNVAKLANFADMDAFVLVACPESSLLDDYREYFQPVLTPFELQVMLEYGNASFDMESYNLEFVHVLNRFKEFAMDELLIQNQAGEQSSCSEATPTQLAQRASMELNIVGPGSAASYLNARSWKGLEYSADQAAKKATQGMRGTASRYEHEEAS